MKSFNAIVAHADVRFFPELSTSQIELTLRYQRGTVLFRAPMSVDSMLKILSIFNKDRIYDLNGQYCRMSLDEETGRIDSIGNIMYDELGELQDNPVVA